MAKNRQKLIHLHGAKAPDMAKLKGELSDGEIAINSQEGSEKIYIKNSGGNIVDFSRNTDYKTNEGGHYDPKTNVSTAGTSSSSSNVYIKGIQLDSKKHVVGVYTGTPTDTNTHLDSDIWAGVSGTNKNDTASNPYVKVGDSGVYKDQIRLVGDGATTVKSDASGNITISSTNTTYSTRPNPHPLTLKGNGTVAESYDGDPAGEVNFTGSGIATVTASDGVINVHVPDTNTDTIYTHPNSGVKAGTYGGSSSITASEGQTISVPYFTVNSQGHLTSAGQRTVTAKDTHWTSKNVVGASGSTANAATSNGGTYLNHLEGESITSKHLISGSGATTVKSDASGNITISSTDTKYSKLPNPNSLTLKVGNTVAETYSGAAVGSVNFAGGGIAEVSAKDGEIKVTVPNTNTDTATTEGGHYEPTGKTSVNTTTPKTQGQNVTVITSLSKDSKGHVTSATGANFTIPDISGKSNNGHKHVASDITGGTFAVDRIPNLSASKITSGTISIERLPAAAIETIVPVKTDAERLKLTKTQVQKGDTVKVTDTGKLYLVVDENQLTVEAGYIEYSAGKVALAEEAEKVNWSNVYGRPSTLPNPNSLTLKVGNTVAETYSGSAVGSVNFTGSGIAEVSAKDGEIKINVPDTNSHYTTGISAGNSGNCGNAAVGNPYVKVCDSGNYRSQVRFVGGGATTVKSDASGNVTISSTNTTYSTRPNPYPLTLKAGDNVAEKYDGDPAGEVNFTGTGIAKVTAKDGVINVDVPNTNSWRPIVTDWNGDKTDTSISQSAAKALYNKLVNGYASSAGSADSANYANYINGKYTSNGGAQYPKYVPSGKVRWNMMRLTSAYSNIDTGSYVDFQMADTYTGNDVPYVTLMGVTKAKDSELYFGSGDKGGEGTSHKWNLRKVWHNANLRFDYGGSGKYYPVKLNDNHQAYVYVPWTDYDTHWTTGISAGNSGVCGNAAVSNPYVKVCDNSTYRSQVRFVGGDNVSVSSNSGGTVTISAVDTTYSTRPNPYSLTLKGNGTIAETYSGAATGSVNFTGSGIAKVTASDGVINVEVPNTNTDTHYTTSIKTGKSGTNANDSQTDPYVKVFDNDAYRSQIQLKGGSNVSVSSNTAGAITISATDTKYSTLPNPYSLTLKGNGTTAETYSGSATGSVNFVGGGIATVSAKDGEIKVYVPDTNTHWTSKNVVGAANSTANAATSNGGTYLNHLEGASITSKHLISGSGATTVKSDASGNITISSTNTTYSTRPNPYALTLKGSGTVAESYDGDPAGEVNFTGTGIAKVTASDGVINVHVPDTNTDTIYTHPNSGVKAGTYGGSSSITASEGQTISVPYFTVNSQGHLTSAGQRTVTAKDTHYITDIRAGKSTTHANDEQSNPYIKIFDNSTYRSQIQIKGGGHTSVSSDTSGIITISSTWPSTCTPNPHTHPWSDITGEPATATRWPTFEEVTSKPLYNNSGDAPLDILKKEVKNYKRNTLVGTYLGHGSASYGMGWVLSGYDSSPYCGFIVNNYGDDWSFIGASNGTWTERTIWHSGNFNPSSKSNTGHKHTISDITNIGSASVNYATSAGNSDKLDGHDSSYFATAHTHPYVPLSGGTMTGTGGFIFPDTFSIDSVNGWSMLYQQGDNTTIGTKTGYSTIRSGNDNIYHDKNGTTYTMWDSSNLNPDNYVSKVNSQLLQSVQIMGTSSGVGNLNVGNKVYLNANGTGDVTCSTITSTNGFFESDERLKDFTSDLVTDFDKIKAIPKKYYYWKDKEKRGSGLQIGTSAQELQKVYPELVNKDENGYLSVDYARLSVIALKAVDELHEENEMLKERLRKIEEKLGL